MKKIIFTLILLISWVSLFNLHSRPTGQSPVDSWLSQAIACTTPEGAAKLLPKLEKLETPEKYLYLGIVFHNLAANGQPDCTAKAVENCRQAVEKKPSPLAHAYLGSALTLQGGDDFRRGDTSGAVQNLQDGVKQLDEAVASAPQEINLRILRIENSFALTASSPYNREDKIVEDLGFLKSILEKLPPEIRSFCHLKGAVLDLKNKKVDLALQGFEKAVQAAPSSAYAQEAKKELARLEK